MIFALTDRYTKETRIFSKLNKLTKDNLLKYVKNKVNQNAGDINIEDKQEEFLSNTWAFSDSFSRYRIINIKRLGNILKRINHSMYIGYGLFHTNIIEIPPKN